MGDFDAKCCFYFCFIKYRVCRTVGLCRIFGCMQRFHFAGGYSCQAMNSHCEIIPGTNAFIAEMVDAADYTFIYNGIDGTCQVISISRGSDLVENNSQAVTLFSKTDHCLHKIIAESGIEPCGTDNYRFLTIIHHIIFSFQLSSAIYRIRTRVTIFRIRNVGSAVKHIIGRNLYHCRTIKLCSTCQLFRRFTIQLIGQFRVIFRFIYRRVSCTVHNQFYSLFRNISPYSLFITDVQFLHICEIIKFSFIHQVLIHLYGLYHNSLPA